MSVADKKTPDYKGSLEGGGIADTERGAIAIPLIRKDKDLETKTNVPDGFVMAVLDTFEYMSKGEWVERPEGGQPTTHKLDSVSSLMRLFGERYRVDMMSENGWSTGNYVAVASAPLSLTDMRMQQAQEERMKEGNKK